jgi:hypothetical protein
MKSFKSRQDWKTLKIDIAPIRIRYRVTGALNNKEYSDCIPNKINKLPKDDNMQQKR